MEIPGKAIEVIKKAAAGRDIYVVDIAYKRDGGELTLKVLADKEGGINMEECASLNRELIDIFDKENIIEESYVFEVSSPGLDRKLVKNEDFIWALGKNLRITTYGPVEGKHTFTGALLGLGDGSIIVESEGISTEIPRDKVASAKLTLE